MKKQSLKQIGVFALNFLPLLCCIVFKCGIIADILTILLMFLPLYMNYKYSKTVFSLILHNIILAISTSATMYFLTHLYLKFVTGDYDYGTILIGKIFLMASLILIFIVSVVTIILKLKRKN